MNKKLKMKKDKLYKVKKTSMKKMGSIYKIDEYKIGISNNPVETCYKYNRVSELRCSGANTSGSLLNLLEEMMV